MVLAILGDFVFQVRTAPFDQLRRKTGQRIAANPRVGNPPAHQYIGPGDDALSITGVLAPEITRGPSAMDDLRAMAAEGVAYSLVDGQGYYLGEWIIESIDDSRSAFHADGQARKIEFGIELRRDVDWWDAAL